MSGKERETVKRQPVDNPVQTPADQGKHGTIGTQIKTAPSGGGTPARSLTTTTETESMMADAKHTHTPPPAYLDGCPKCLTRDNRPLTTADSGGKQVPGVIATYFCNDCGHTWWTSWMAEVAE